MEIVVENDNFLLTIGDILIFPTVIPCHFNSRFDRLNPSVLGQDFIAVRTETRTKLRNKFSCFG